MLAEAVILVLSVVKHDEYLWALRAVIPFAEVTICFS
jgi:hypothetical protein